MSIVRLVAVLFLGVSVALAGVPAQAMPGAMKDCPMMKMQQEAAKQDMEKHGCCPKAEKQQSQKQSPSGCCDDSACNVKCSASGGMSLSAPSKGGLPRLTRQTQRLYPTDAALASHLFNTQDRPPKHLS